MLTRAQGIRVVADVILVVAALALGLALRVFWVLTFEQVEGPREEVVAYWVRGFLLGAALLTPISQACFWGFGFYTYGRAYRGRYKALVVTQAVTLAYLVFGFSVYFVSGTLGLPRGALLLSWALTVVTLVAARLWSLAWRGVVQLEAAGKARPGERAIETVLLIGGAGYIGSALLPLLLERGYRVRLLDLMIYGEGPLGASLGHPKLELIQADFRQVDAVVRAMQGVDAVIHLGAIVGDPACALDEDLTVEVNLTATRLIAEVAKGVGVQKFLFASTCSVYGAGDELLDERSGLRPVSLYARSKIASEKVLRGLATDTFRPTCLRFGTIYGLSGRTRFDLVINLLSAKAAIEGEITVFGGEQWRPFVHVLDAARAVFLVLEASQDLVGGEVFNVGSDAQNYTIQGAAEEIQRLVPAARIVSMGDDSDLRNYRVNFAKIRNRLGFEPEWTIERGVRQVLDAVASGAVSDYRAAQYSNVKFLTEGLGGGLTQHYEGWTESLIADESGESDFSPPSAAHPRPAARAGSD